MIIATLLTVAALQVPVYIKPPDLLTPSETQFVDAESKARDKDIARINKRRIDSTEDLRKILAKKKEVRLVDSEADAVLVIGIVGSDRVSTGWVTTTTYVTRSRSGSTARTYVEEDKEIAVFLELQVGDYENTFIGTPHGDYGAGGMAYKPWTRSAYDAASQFIQWVKDNADKLEK